MKRITAMGWVAMGTLCLGTGALRADDEATIDVETTTSEVKTRIGAPARPAGDEKKYRDFAEVTKGAEKHDGLFTLHQKDEHLYAEIKPNQFDQPLLAPIMIARGMAMAGQPLNFGDEWVLIFKRVGDRVQLVRRNIHYKAPAGTPLERAVKQNYTDSILMALPIVSINGSNNQSVVIDLSDIFFTDFAQLGFGAIDRSRTRWHKVKTFANNLELEVEATFGAGRPTRMFGGGDGGVADGRGRTIVIHYSLARLPDSAYKVRHADDRVGHFLSATKDFGSSNPDTTFVRQVNRWRIEKSDPKAKLSPPKKQLVWYVENTVPDEYRPYVEAGILEWNKAFEKIGIRNALAVRWQQEGRDDFDPEDINYCTFRWITAEFGGAMSCLRANPLTGEMIDGDVIFDADMVRFFKQEFVILSGTPATAAAGDVEATTRALAIGEVISPIMAAKKGYGLSSMPPIPPSNAPMNDVDELHEVVPASWSNLQIQLRRRQATGQLGACQYSAGMRSEMAIAAIALAEPGKDEKEKEKDQGAADEIKLPEEFLGQMIKMVVMHEVGHSLGLRHNFKASTMLSPDQLNDTAITRVKGMAGSVMDYLPPNIVPKGQKQGDYTTTTIGPYDYWAIEYAYKPIDGDEAAELKKIARRAPDPDLVYATDEDMHNGNDPYVNVWDLGSDTLRYARDRTTLASELLKSLEARVVKDGESWSRLRSAFSMLLMTWGNAAHLAASQVGGHSVSRDHKGDPDARDPIVPLKSSRQREALAYVGEQILSDRAFKFSPALLRKLASERWYHWGNEDILVRGGVDYPINERILSIQKIVLGQLLDAGVLARLQNQENQVDQGTEPLRMAEVFQALTDSIWSEISSPKDAGADDEHDRRALDLSTIRRNLQREHLRQLGTIVLGQRSRSPGDLFAFVQFSGGSRVPADARSLARMHLRRISDRIDTLLKARDVTLDDTTRAHLEECVHRTRKVLDAGLDANEP